MEQRQKTQIICTIGPTSQSEEVLEEMYKKGMGVVRLNMSHSSHQDCLKVIQKVRRIEKKHNTKIPIAIDTCGPEFRISLTSSFFVNPGDMVEIVPVNKLNNCNQIGVNLEKFACIKDKSIVKINDGKLVLQIINKQDFVIRARAENALELVNNKQIHFEFTQKDFPFLNLKDKADLEFALENEVDYIFLSFVETVENVMEVKDFIKNTNIAIFSKIESTKGVNNSKDISRVSDGVMIARGDLLMDVGTEKLFSSQHAIIKNCKDSKIILATEVIHSMTTSEVPLRSEISDIGHAVLDGCYGILLSSETSVGQFPIHCVNTVRKICIDAESLI